MTQGLWGTRHHVHRLLLYWLLGLCLCASVSVAQQTPAPPAGAAPALSAPPGGRTPSGTPSAPRPARAPSALGAQPPSAGPSQYIPGQPLAVPPTAPLSTAPALASPSLLPVPTAPLALPPPTPQSEGPPLSSATVPLLPTSLPPDELSPIERLVAGSTPDPNALLRQFGYDLFTRPPTTFAPVTDVPVGPDYILGPGDHLNILLWGGIQDSVQVEVDRNGAIALQRLGVIQVSGLTLDQTQRLLQQRLSEFFPDFRMAVTLGQLRTILVYVVGEVRQPGAYTVSSLATIVNALFASGGPTKNGSLRHIQLVRQGRKLHTLDLYDFLLRGNKSQDAALQSGDTILVPLIGPVAGVAGSVKRPAIYEIEPATTLRQLLDLAGSITSLGYLQRVQIERSVANQKKIVADFDLSAPSPRSKAPATDVWQTRITDGDVIRVFSIVNALENFVQIEGHVTRPGHYELKPGMRLRDLLPSYEPLQPEPYLEYAEIIRYIGADLRRTVVPLNLGAMLAGDPEHNVRLHPQDIVRIFPRSDFVDPAQTRISGLVHKPGIYALTEGMRISDLLFRSGSFLKFAYLERAELTRRTLGSTGETAVRIELNLNKALAGDTEHNLFLQDFDHLVVRQIPDIELQRDVEIVDENVLPAGRLSSGRALDGQSFDTRLPDSRGPLEGRPQDSRALLEARSQESRLQEGRLQDRRSLLPTRPQDRFTPKLYPIIPQDERAVAALQRAGRFIERTIEIRGEVPFPGIYPVLKGERLSSVIQRAGGFTANAYLRGSVFTRAQVKEEQEKRLQELIREEEAALLTESATEAQTSISPEEAKSQQQAVDFRRELLTRLRVFQPEGRIVMRLRPLETFAGAVDDLELEPGDQLVIPSIPRYINVLGDVYNRTSLLYEPKKTIAYYLEKVGGIKPTANEDEIYLVQIDGTVISNTQNQFAIVLANGQSMKFKNFFAVQPQPGDSIIVPRQVTTAATLRNLRDIVQIIFQSVSSLGVIAALVANL